MNVRVPNRLVDRIDTARGRQTRDSWVARACEVALRDTAALVDPDLQTPIHRHDHRQLVGSRMDTAGNRSKLYQCSCGDQMEQAT